MSGDQHHDSGARGSVGDGDRADEVGRGVILVAEDAPLNQNLMSAMLQQLGYRHRIVADGAQAVEFAAANQCALVLMDLQMPVMDGQQAARAIRKLPGDVGRVPIVFISGNLGDLEDACLRLSGMVGSLGKPFRLSELMQTIRAYARTAAPT